MQSRRFLAALALAPSLLTLTACTTLRVESNPSGAQVLWSPDGTTNWQPWPPPSWRATADSTAPSTPFASRGTFGDTVYVTVEKEGYWRPLPKPVELYFARTTRLQFDLQELPETKAARLRSEGFVLYRDEWIRPEERGLVEYKGEVLSKAEAFRREQLDRGLVEFEGEWLTPAEKQTRVNAAMAAKGLVEFEGRWVTPEERDIELRVASEVEAIAADKAYPDLPTPKVSGSSQRESAQLQLSNSTGQVIRFLISGPTNREVILQPYGSAGVKGDNQLLVPAGTYRMVIIPTGKDAAGRDLAALLGRTDSMTAVALSTTPLYGSWPLAAGQQYSFNYTGADSNLRDNLRDFTPPEPQLDFTPPSIEIPEVELPKEPEQPQGRPGGEGRRGGGGGRGRPPG